MFRRNAKPFFQRQKAERLVHDPMGNPSLLFEGGFMMPSWERRPMLDLAGAQAYAYEGLVLPVTALMGGGYEYQGMNFITPPMIAQAATLPTSYGIYAATPYTQPLYQPLPTGKQ